MNDLLEIPVSAHTMSRKKISESQPKKAAKEPSKVLSVNMPEEIADIMHWAREYAGVEKTDIALHLITKDSVQKAVQEILKKRQEVAERGPLPLGKPSEPGQG